MIQTFRWIFPIFFFSSRNQAFRYENDSQAYIPSHGITSVEEFVENEVIDLSDQYVK